MPTIVLAAPAGNPSTQSAGFTRNPGLPKWATPLAEVPPTERTDPVVMRLNETQSLLGALPASLYNRAFQVNDSSQLGVIGQFQLSYFAQYQKLILHRVVILRGEQKLDRTNSVNIRPLQRETNIESGMLGGATNLQLLLDDVRIGDTLWITYTVEGENPVFGKRWSSDFSWDSSMPVELRRVTVSYPRNRPLAWRQLGDFQPGQIAPQTEQVGELTRLRFEGRALEAVENEPSLPSDYLPARLLQLTEYQDWNSVALWADSLFPKLAASPALKALAHRFAGEATPEARAAAALHWVQDEIRYFSVSIGENSHRPQPPDVVLQRRYGDCKDKSYLLISLLRELGVQAQPLLLSADSPKVAAKLLPTPNWFNHVIVQISIDGQDYYVDPTRINQPEPLSTMPIAFPGAQVLPVNPATQALATIPERSDSLPTFEHNEEFTMADFSGPTTLVTRDVYRSTYADGMRSYYPRLSANEQKKAVLSKYEKLYPGISLDGAPEYKDVVNDNRIEIVSRYKLPKGVSLKDKRYQLAFRSQVIDGSLGIPAKLVRNFPFDLAGGRYSGRYRLSVHWPQQVRRVDPPHVKMLDNPYFAAREEFTLRGADMDYLLDYRLKQRTVPAAELPALEEQSKLLDEFIEGTMRIDEASVSAPEMQMYSLRDLESLRHSKYLLSQLPVLKGKKDADITLDQACDYLITDYDLNEFIGSEAALLAQRLHKLVQAAKPQPGLGACRAELALAYGKSQEAIDALAADPLSDDSNPLLSELAWALFYTGDQAGALATMERYRAARQSAAGGMTDPVDAASQIALLQRSGQPLPAALDQFARAMPDGPWPRPVLAMQVGLLTPEQLLAQVGAMRGDSAALAMMDARFYIGQTQLAAGKPQQAMPDFAWVSGQGLRNHVLAHQARREITLNFTRDRSADAGMQAALRKDYVGAVAIWQKGAAAGSSASQYGLGLAALNGEGLPKSDQQARRWFQQAADLGDKDGQAMLGFMYLYGSGGAQDTEQGLAWLRRAAAQGDAKSQQELGRRYRWGDGVKQDYAQAYTLLLSAANAGRAEAMAQLGAMYAYGEGVDLNYTLADFWNQRGAQYSNASALFNLGVAAETGKGVAQDPVRAAQWYRMAAQYQHAGAASKLGLIYKEGIGVPRDLALALQYLTQAADGGDLDAMINLGYFYETERKDYAKARLWYEIAADKQQSDAEYNLALLYQKGLGMPADQTQALVWFRRAAEHGYANAQFALAEELLEQDAAARDLPQAVAWLDKAASQGLASAQHRLGELYLRGTGVEADEAKAVQLFHQAAAQGYQDAYLKLGRAYQFGRGVTADMAQAIVWYEKVPDNMEAQVRLGMWYLGAGKEPERGRKLLEQAERQADSAPAYAELGSYYRKAGNDARTEWAYLCGLKHAEQLGAEYQWHYLDMVAAFYSETAQHAKAVPLRLRQLQLTEKLYDANSPQKMALLEALGDLYQMLGRYTESEASYQQALVLKERIHGARSVEMANMLNSLAGLFVAAGQYDRAEEYNRRALALDESLGSPRLAARLQSLASTLLYKGQYTAAQQQLLRAVALQEQNDARDDGELAGTLNTLAAVYDRLQAYDQAGVTLERALALLGQPSPQTEYVRAIYQSNLARVRVGQQRYAEASALLQQSQAVKARLMGEDHSEMSFGLLVEGLLYERQHQYDQAVVALRRALELRQHYAGYPAAAKAEALQELGEVYRLQGQDEQAAPLLQQALEIRSRIQGEQHPELQATRRSLAALQARQVLH